jgi:hypothetical protein
MTTALRRRPVYHHFYHHTAPIQAAIVHFSRISTVQHLANPAGDANLRACDLSASVGCASAPLNKREGCAPKREAISL